MKSFKKLQNIAILYKNKGIPLSFFFFKFNNGTIYFSPPPHFNLPNFYKAFLESLFSYLLLHFYLFNGISFIKGQGCRKAKCQGHIPLIHKRNKKIIKDHSRATIKRKTINYKLFIILLWICLFFFLCFFFSFSFTLVTWHCKGQQVPFPCFILVTSGNLSRTTDTLSL